MTQGVLRLAQAVCGRLEALGVEVVVGGSVASSVVGEPRATLDLDIAVRGAEGLAEVLLAAFDDGYYISADAVRDAVRRRSSFNAIHLETMQKVDVFVLGDGPLDTMQLDRRVQVRVHDIELWVGSPEDQILRKLWWYRLGEETSERQWRDVVAIVRLQGDLDDTYLDQTAALTGLSALLARARAAGGQGRHRPSP